MTTKESALQKISELVQRFNQQFESYKRVDYNETMTRRDFIDPFFKALGWDIDNEQGFAEAYREVIHEDRVKVGSATKAPDYSFRLVGGKRLFFVEAKKPSVDIKEGVQSAYQVRRYGWSAKLSICVITDFEEFSVYDCNSKPKPDDKASVARIRYIHFNDYLKEFDFLWDTFSKEQVLKGSFDKFLQGTANKKGTATVDKDFLQSLDNWRSQLASSISRNNHHLDEDELNFAVQQTIDRIIFLRIAEDRGIEPYGNLQKCIESATPLQGGQGGYYQNLFEQFILADDKYNSGLFDFKKDQICSSLLIENKVVKSIINELYYPVSPYEFSVLSVEILGSAYEQFLGKVIRVTPAHFTKIEEKPEVRKAGGVYYTPQYIVDYIVQNTVGKLIQGKTPAQVAEIKICDPACGSGSFLIGAFQYLLDWHKNYYNARSPLSSRRGVGGEVLTPQGNLTTAEKKRILLNNIYGVDIDVNAVEVTKLSLLLKCLEGETSASIAYQFSMFNERVLPTLDNNIKDGNSLIDTDYYDGDLFETERKTKPFNWQKAFPEVFKIKPADPNQELKYHVKKVEALQKDTNNLIEKIKDEIEEPKERYGVSRGFDCVIGNPPYVRQELLGIQKNYFELRYRVYHGMADLYSYFIERGITLLNDNGIFGIIVANKWMRANYGEPLRKWLKQQTIHEIIDFGDLQVFESVTTYPCILIAGKPSKNIGSIDVTNVKSLSFDSLQNYVQQNRELILKNSLDDSGWNLASETETNLLDKLKQNSKPLGKYVDGKIYRGVLTGLSEAFVIDESTKDQLIVEDYKNTEVIKPFLAGRDIKRYQPVNFNKYLIFFPKGYTNKKGNYPKNAWKWLQEYYPSIANYLEPYKAKGEKRFDKGDYWWELRACDYYDEFENPKIIYQVFQVKPCFVWDENGCFCNNSIWIIPQNDKYLLAILNSSLGWYMISTYCTKIQNGYQLIYKYFEKLLIKNIDFSIQEEKSNHDKIINQVDQLLQLNQEKQDCKLESRLNQIQSKIDYCEDRINAIVYELYGLTEEEIKIVEGK